MKIIIDGYNLLHQLKFKTKNLSEKREKLIFLLLEFVKINKVDIMVVFDGKNPPYFEDSRPSPIGVYGQTKYQGEEIIKNQAMIIRISYPYRASFKKKRDFFRTFKTFLEEKKPLKMITNSLMTPTFIDDIAFGLKYLIKNFSREIFHLVGGDSLSPYEIGLLIAKKFKLDKSLIKKILFTDFTKGKPYFPQWSVIKSKKNNFWKMKTFEEGLVEIKKQLKNLS
jgi:dTDP-4-dehydrorhamnose reductase